MLTATAAEAIAVNVSCSLGEELRSGSHDDISPQQHCSRVMVLFVKMMNGAVEIALPL